MKSNRGQAGFSMVELMVALVMTLIVSGAIFGLLSGGQNAFKLQPELSDRQQNIRLAMALIETDIGRGGTKMGAFAQVFTNGLDGVGPLGLAGNSDFLEVFGSDGECPDTAVQLVGANIISAFRYPDCYPDVSPVLLGYATAAPPAPPPPVPKWGFASNIQAQALTFGAQPATSEVQVVPDQICGGLGCAAGGPLPARIAPLDIVRYEIAIEADGTPSLFRSERGGFTAGGAYVPAPAVTGGWQLVARGIEDLQVQYQVGVAPPPPPPWPGQPGVVVANNPTTVVTRVRVTLSARSTVARIQGQGNANLGVAQRGQLTSVITPRSSLLGIQGIAPNQWR